jgi:hypothetical protein
MTEKRNFQSFINETLGAGFERFFDIEYPAQTRSKDSKVHKAAVEKLARNWVGTVMLKIGTRGHAHITVTEERSDGSIIFHIFLGGCDWEKFEKGKYPLRWYRVTGGSAYERAMNPARLGGLLHYFVMNLDCPIDVFAGDINSVFRRADSRSVVVVDPRSQRSS